MLNPLHGGRVPSLVYSHSLLPSKLIIQKPHKRIAHLLRPQPPSPHPHGIIAADIGPIQANPLPLQPLQSGQGQHRTGPSQIVRRAVEGDMGRDEDGGFGNWDRDDDAVAVSRTGRGLRGQHGTRGRIGLGERSDGCYHG